MTVHGRHGSNIALADRHDIRPRPFPNRRIDQDHAQALLPRGKRLFGLPRRDARPAWIQALAGRSKPLIKNMSAALTHSSISFGEYDIDDIFTHCKRLLVL